MDERSKFMKSTIEDLKTRRSIKKYNEKAVSEDDLKLILEAGMNAPTGRGAQSPIMVVVQNPDDLATLERLNSVVGGNPETRNFYGAKTVVVVLADKSIPTYVYDGALVMGNLMNAAHSLGIGSCWIHRAKETFETVEGKALLDKWGIKGDYEGIGNCLLGYFDIDFPEAKPRKENWVYRVK